MSTGSRRCSSTTRFCCRGRARMIGRMTDEAPKPKRKRRLWIVVGVLLFVVVTVWRYWPRGDARFVGNWEFTSVGDQSVKFLMQIEFRSNGSAVYVGSEKSIVPFPWSAEASTITFGEPKGTLMNWNLADWLWARFRLLTSNAQAFFWGEMTYEIVEYTPSVMKLRDKRSCEYELRRVHE
jgi:hypothetical protein